MADTTRKEDMAELTRVTQEALDPKTSEDDTEKLLERREEILDKLMEADDRKE